MIWFPHFLPKREGTATAPEGKVDTNNAKAFYLLRQLQRDVCTRIHQKSHLLCKAPKEKGRVAHTNPHHADWNSDPKTVKGEKQRVQQANLKIISSLLLAVCRQDSQKTHKREMKSRCLPWRKIACLRSPPVALMQKQTVTPIRSEPAVKPFTPRDNSHHCQFWTLSELCLLSCTAGFGPAVRSARRAAVSCSVTLPRVSAGILHIKS